MYCVYLACNNTEVDGPSFAEKAVYLLKTTNKLDKPLQCMSFSPGKFYCILHQGRC